jgi:hypothetical protein
MRPNPNNGIFEIWLARARLLKHHTYTHLPKSKFDQSRVTIIVFGLGFEANLDAELGL